MSYYQDVQDVVALIPKGRVTTYGAIADFLTLGSARMVGWALKQSTAHAIPAHRVVNRKGELTGRANFVDPTYMEEALIKDGVTVKDNKIVGFESVFWHPEELVKK